MHDLEPFVPRSFIGKMLGMGDMARLFETVQDSMGGKETGGLMKSLEKGKFTLGDMRDQFATISSMGPMSKVLGMYECFDCLGMMPGVPAEMMGGVNDADGAKKIKTYLCIIDSMTEEEVLSDGKMFYKEPTRIKRVARGSGGRVMDVEELLQQHGMFAGMVKKMGGNKGMLNQMKKGGGAGRGGGGAPVNPMAQISKMFPPGMMEQMGGMNGIQGMMEQMGMGGGTPDMGKMQEMMEKMGMAPQAGTGRGGRRKG
jgi:signal recognition particle subunit SRP54